MTAVDVSPSSPSSEVPAPSPRASPLQRLSRFGRPPRIMGVDIARGIAVIGMIGAHIGITETFDWARIETWTDLVHGRSSLLFALLAGVSIALLSGGVRAPSREELPRLRLQLVGRGAVVFTIGLVLEMLNTNIAIILTLYGVLFVVVIPFLRFRRRSLWLLAGALAVAGPPLLALVKALSLHAMGAGLDLVVFGMYPASVWLALLLAGMAIGRTDLRPIRTAVTLLVGGVLLTAVGYGVAGVMAASNGGASTVPASESSASSTEPGGSAGALPEGKPIAEMADDALVCSPLKGYVLCYPEGTDPFSAASSSGGSEEQPYVEQVLASDVPGAMITALTDVEPHSGGALEILGSSGMGIAILGLCLLLSRPLRWLLLPLAALGSMPLTVYSTHVVVIVVAGGLFTATDNGFWLWLSLGLIAFSTLWVAFVGAGPLERLAKRAANAMALVPPRTRAQDATGAPLDSGARAHGGASTSE